MKYNERIFLELSHLKLYKHFLILHENNHAYIASGRGETYAFFNGSVVLYHYQQYCLH